MSPGISKPRAVRLPPRRVVSITGWPVDRGYVCFALDDRGAVWSLLDISPGGPSWVSLPPLPSDEP